MGAMRQQPWPGSSFRAKPEAGGVSSTPPAPDHQDIDLAFKGHRDDATGNTLAHATWQKGRKTN